jgi:ATP-dependent helicase/DNAse subunit B
MRTSPQQGQLFARRLITGAAGSGKTHAILHLYRDAWAAGESKGGSRLDGAGRAAQTLLIVPTVSFREHTRNSLLRLIAERDPAAVLTGRGVVTFGELAPEPPPMSAVRRELLVRRLLSQADIPYFREVTVYPGFRETLADEADEVLAAGLRAADLARALRGDSTRGRAFLEFLRVYERAVARPPGPEPSATPSLLLVDGFTDFTHRQKQVLEQLINRAAVSVITLPESSDTARQMLIRDMAFAEERLEGHYRGDPERTAFCCHDRREEIELVAGEIEKLVRHHNYRFREIGVIVQRPEVYLRPLADLFHARSIPARLFFPISAAETSMGRHLLACLRLFHGEPDSAAALDVLKSGWCSRYDRSTVYRLEFRLIEGKRPGDLATDFFATIDRLRRERPSAKPAAMARWVLQVWESLTDIGEIVAADHARASELRADALTWRRARELPGEVAVAIEAERADADLGDFLTLLERELRALRFRVRDRRSDTVHVMNAYEARQWEMRAVFVVGMVEGEFPRPSRPALFLSDAERLASVLPTTVALMREQESLYDVAVTRAREKLTITWPRADGRGGDLIASRFVAGLPFETPPFVATARAGIQPPDEAMLRTTLVRDRVRASQVEFSASKFQEFARCPYKHFANHLLHLQGRPSQENGVTAKLAGTIVHAAIAEWEKSEGRGDIAAFFDAAFTQHTRGIVLRHADEKIRARMLTDLLTFAENERLWPQTYRTRLDPRYVEYAFRLPLDLPDGACVAVHGRIDRVETLPSSGGEIGLAVDFKYNSKHFTKGKVKETREGLEYQIPVYLLALRHIGLRPAGIEFYNLRGQPKRAGVLEDSLLGHTLTSYKNPGVVISVNELVAIGTDNMTEGAREIRNGVIAVEPNDPKYCKKGPHGCDFYDVCRVNKWQR